jgi:sugar (pentulose or hexulose) kinase
MDSEPPIKCNCNVRRFHHGINSDEVFGTHSCPRRGAVSSLVRALGIEGFFPRLRRAFEPLGPIKPDIADATGLAPGTPVFCGIHDSNAALLPYLVSREAPFTVLSTGTWVILLCVGLSYDQLDPRDDTLANIDALGRPNACGRFMGGREYAVIAGRGGNPDIAAVARVIASGAMALPCFSGQGAPMRRPQA